jgi:hypothetical protein
LNLTPNLQQYVQNHQVTNVVQEGKLHEDDSEAHQIFRAAAGHTSKKVMPTTINPVSHRDERHAKY